MLSFFEVILCFYSNNNTEEYLEPGQTALLTLTVQNYKKKQFMSHKSTTNPLFNDIFCYYIIGCFD